MYKQEGTKVAIIGAGAVGSTTAFAIAMQQLCSELVLIDVNKDKAKGEALDISHGLPFIGDMYIHDGDYSDVKDAEGNYVAQTQFTAGYSYLITVKVYGLEEIEISAELEPWKDGGRIDIDTDVPPTVL